MEVKHIDFKNDWFEANGKKYFIRNTMNIERYSHFEKIQNHFAFGLTFKQIHERLQNSINLANKGKGVEAWNVIFNLMEGVAYRLEDRVHPALMICSLFMVTDDEDLTQWDEQLAKSKTEDWKAEGIDIQDFFQFASNFVHDFLKVYAQISRNILMEEEKSGKRKPTDNAKSK